MHKKLVIWLDLNIQNDEYAHAKIVEAMKKINELQERYSYLPTKLEFQHCTLEDQGSYHLSTQFKGVTEQIAYMEALTLGINDMERLIKKNFKLSEEKIDKFKHNNPVQNTLREEIEKI